MKLSKRQIDNLNEVTTFLMINYAEEKVIKRKIPSKKQVIRDMEKNCFDFISLSSRLLCYSSETIITYHNTMMMVVNELVDDAIMFIEADQQ